MGKGTSNYCCMRDIKYVNQNKHECNCITPPLNVIVTRNLNKNIKKEFDSSVGGSSIVEFGLVGGLR